LGERASGSLIQLILDPANYPTDHAGDYEGTVSGTTVTASGHYYGSELCGGVTIIGVVNYGVPSTFTGTFSADGVLITGHEIRTSMLGQKSYTYEYDWRTAPESLSTNPVSSSKVSRLGRDSHSQLEFVVPVRPKSPGRFRRSRLIA
jgi:hypothetical protein